MQRGLGFLDHPGEMADRIRAHDWSRHPLGAPESWPQALRFILDLVLSSSFPMAIYWGRDYHLLYNDAWSAIPADRHPWALGRPGAEVWADIWDVVGPEFDNVRDQGIAFASYDQLLMMARNGVAQETYWNYSGTPIRDEDSQVVGVLNQGNETTRFVLAERTRQAEVLRLHELFQQSPGAVALLHGAEQRFELANDAFLELVGRRDLLGKRVADAMPEVVDQGFVALLENVFSTGKTYRAWGEAVRLARSGDGALEERIVDFVYQPIRNAAGTVTDIFIQATDVTDRAQAEAALRESQARLQLALNVSQGVGTWDWDVVNDRVTADAGFARMYGVEEQTAQIGAPLVDFFSAIHPDDAERVRTAVDSTLLTGAAFSEEYRLVQPDGSTRWVAAQGRALRSDGGDMVRFPGITFDITNRKAAEEAARSTAEELRAATEAQSFLYALAERQRALDTPEAIMCITASALGERLGLDRAGFYRVGENGDIDLGPGWTNGAMPELRGGFTADELGAAQRAQYESGRTLIVSDTARDPSFNGSAIARTTVAAIGVPLLRHGRWVASMYGNCASPREWPAEEVAFIEAVAEITWDAVERVAAVAALKESEGKFRAIANSIDHMVWSSLPDGRIDYLNERWYDFTGATDRAMIGDDWAQVVHPDDRDNALEGWRTALATGQPYHLEYRMRHAASNGWRWVLARASAVRDDGGAITRWFGTCTDIQDIVDAREILSRSREELERAVDQRTRQLMSAEDQLRQAQKMEAVGQLTGGIAHDFNNMLAVVIGALDLLERRLAQGSTDVGRYVMAARDGATRAAGLTQRLLAFARQSPLAARPIDVNQMVRGMIELLIRTIGDDIRVETKLGERSGSAIADPSQLENVILNLAVNARDAMPRGGTLTIATDRAHIGADMAAGYGISPGDYVTIAVADTGEGMAPETAARAFEPFFTTKGVGKGTGLGLSQVFGFVRQSAGHVRIDSQQGSGTTVCVYLPSTGALVATDLPPRAKTLVRGAEVVLVVEDEDRVRAHSVEALRELGYDVTHASSGAEAIALLDAGRRPALLFTDVVMPGMTGPELARLARDRLPGLRVLYTSGYTGDVAGDDGLDAPILPKPFDLSQLALGVRQVLDA
ncbi:PAS domain-containing protein [Sphingomonas qomolangmaensis]|uniref:histidine kinase n=1 Tax=Sphingomonas qomolangmaensis TaxID=2918765 RepID=A0ABY5L8A4_9SPHN|nr:PAS domain-containing protein [Sphingomonas qomolangmaensis]UUL81828.1 PAS domain-containing protein [Sphingomonas qomolangmaensis]